jgi:hypothetical protein
MRVALVEPLFQEDVPCSARSGGKVLALISVFLFAGLGLWSSGAGGQLTDQGPIDTMALLPTAQVSAAEHILSKYGIASGPMERLALTAVAGSRRGTGARDVAALAARMDKSNTAVLANAKEMLGLKAEEMIGVNKPTGFFDPWGYSTNVDGKTLLYFREAELKHGRLGMLATLGIVVGEKLHPLFGGDLDGPAISLAKDIPKIIVPGLVERQGMAMEVPSLTVFWTTVLVACGLIDITGALSPNLPWERFSGWQVKEGWTKDSKEQPGDYGFDPLGLRPPDPKDFADLHNRELNNGRLAMLAAAGMIAQELVTGEKLFQ